MSTNLRRISLGRNIPKSVKQTVNSVLRIPEVQFNPHKIAIPKNETVFEETLYGSVLHYQIQNVSVGDTVGWKSNLRKDQSDINKKKFTDVDEMLVLLADKAVQELARQIIRAGGIIEPLIGMLNVDKQVETYDGNSRRAIIAVATGHLVLDEDTINASHLSKEQKESLNRFARSFMSFLAEWKAEHEILDVLPYKLYLDADEKDLAAIVAIKHIAQPNPWTPEGKGLMAYSMLTQQLGLPNKFSNVKDLRSLWKILVADKESTVDALTEVGNKIRQPKVQRVRELVMATAATLLFKHQYPNYPKAVWAFFYKFYKQAALRTVANDETFKRKSKGSTELEDYLEPDDRLEEKFFKWVADGRLSDCVQVDTLPAIMHFPDAAKVFLNTPIDKKPAAKANEVVQQQEDRANAQEALTRLAEERMTVEDFANALEDSKVYIESMPDEDRDELTKQYRDNLKSLYDSIEALL